MPTTVFLHDLSASYGAHPLFAHLDATLAPGHVTALVGPNGAGKSTLLRIVAGLHDPDSGTVHLAHADATVGYLPQSVPAASETVLEYVRRRTGVADAEASYLAAADALTAGAPGADDAYALAFDRWMNLGGADLDVRLATLTAQIGLGVPLDRPLGALSGGQAARVSLASVLASRFDVLLLDEPTNNLDADGLALVTDFIAAQDAPVLLASHDRALLDAVATDTWELDLPQQRVTHYAGGWSAYRAAKALARSQQIEAHERGMARRDELVEQARRRADWAEKGRAGIASKMNDNAGSRAMKKLAEDRAGRQDARAARARAAVDRVEVPDAPRKEWELRYRLAQAGASADVVVTLDAVVARAGDFRVGPVSASIERGARVALEGANGSGKSTLLAALVDAHPDHGGVQSESGRIAWGTRTSIGYLDQQRALIAGATPLVEHAAGLLGWDDAGEVRTLLAKFGLGTDLIALPCDALSLGERTRAALALWQGRAVNVLVLDEPTNHADVEMIEALEDALGAFDGTVLLVTHDATLREAVAPDVTWSFERRGDRAEVRVG